MSESRLLQIALFPFHTYTSRLVTYSQSHLIGTIQVLLNSNTVVHGDFHPLNVLVEKDGSLKVIDFMNLMHAPFLYDVARTYYLIGTSSKDFAEAYLSTMGYKVSDISEYIELVKLYRKLEEA